MRPEEDNRTKRRDARETNDRIAHQIDEWSYRAFGQPEYQHGRSEERCKSQDVPSTHRVLAQR